MNHARQVTCRKNTPMLPILLAMDRRGRPTDRERAELRKREEASPAAGPEGRGDEAPVKEENIGVADERGCLGAIDDKQLD